MWRLAPELAHPGWMRAAALACVAACVIGGRAASAQQGVDQTGRSVDLFRQMATVLQHPRCMNCHTNAAFPRQGDDRHRHLMNVARGPDDHGAAGLHCSTCHQAANQGASGVPGAADWHLAPLRMAWEGLSVAELCRALFDPKRGGMKPEQLPAHFDTSLVAWAWSPGVDAHGRARTRPPLSHDRFTEITRQWVGSGAICPSE
jgi:hypothetical protein